MGNLISRAATLCYLTCSTFHKKLWDTKEQVSTAYTGIKRKQSNRNCLEGNPDLLNRDFKIGYYKYV